MESKKRETSSRRCETANKIESLNGYVFCDFEVEASTKKVGDFTTVNKDKIEKLTVVIAKKFKEGDTIWVRKAAIQGAGIEHEGKKYIIVREGDIIGKY